MKKSIFFVNTYGCPETQKDLGKMFLLMKEYDLSGLQIPYDDLLNLEKDEFKRLLVENNVDLVCTHVIPRLFAKDEATFNDAIKLCCEALEYVSFFNCEYLMLTAFKYEDVDGFEDKERARERLAEGFEIMTEKAEKYGIKVVVENISQTILPFSTIEDIEFLVNKVPKLKYCFETGNFVCTKTDNLTAFERLKDHIDMVHVKDFGVCADGGYKCDSGISVEHVPFGSGQADLYRVMEKLLETKPGIPYIIEIHDHSPERERIDQACRFVDEVARKYEKI